MKLQNLKEGDKVQVYCYGNLVDAVVIQRDGVGVCVRHKPIRHGNCVCIETWIRPSLYLQRKWGGTDKNGQPSAGSQTTPGAFYKGKPIESDIYSDNFLIIKI